MTLHPYVKDIWNNVKNRKRNASIAICGAVGTGKSYTALTLACMVDKKLRKTTTEEEALDWLKERVIRDPAQLNKLLNNNSLNYGDVIIFDEAGTSADSRLWWKFKNKVLRYNMQIFRNKRLITIFTMPSLTFLDAQARRLIEFYIETRNIDFKEKRVKSMIRNYQVNPRTGEEYRKRPMYIVGGKVRQFDFLKWAKPPKFICNAYEKYSSEFKEQIRRDLAKEGEKIERELNNKTPFDPVKTANEWLENHKDADKPPKIADLRVEYNLSYHKATMIRNYIEKELKKRVTG